MRPRLVVVVMCSAVAAASFAAQVGAQSDAPRLKAISLIAGVAQYDLSGTGTTPLLGARASMELNRWFVGEVAVSAIRPQEQFGPRPTLLCPDLQLQAQLPFSVVRPYVGVGAGFATGSGTGYEARTTSTASVAGGVRAVLPLTTTLLQAELRVRGIGPRYTGVTADWTFGLGHSF